MTPAWIKGWNKKSSWGPTPCVVGAWILKLLFSLDGLPCQI